MLEFYNQHAPNIEIYSTQVGHTLKALRATGQSYQAPRNLGELSIQSLLIDLQLQGHSPAPLVLFEDGWFLRNAEGLAKPFGLISTQAFLLNAEAAGLIKSAVRARAAIANGKRDASLVVIDVGAGPGL